MTLDPYIWQHFCVFRGAEALFTTIREGILFTIIEVVPLVVFLSGFVQKNGIKNTAGVAVDSENFIFRTEFSVRIRMMIFKFQKAT